MCASPDIRRAVHRGHSLLVSASQDGLGGLPAMVVLNMAFPPRAPV